MLEKASPPLSSGARQPETCPVGIDLTISMRFDRALTGNPGGAAESGRIEPGTTHARGYPPPIFGGKALSRIDAGRVVDRIALGERASNVEFAQGPDHATRRGAADLPNAAGTP